MIKINPKAQIPLYITYILHNEKNDPVFFGHCKFVDVLKLSDCVKNPAFDISQNYLINITGFYPDRVKAQNACGIALNGCNPWPHLNVTQQANNSKGMIRCNETGQTWNSQADCVRELNIQQSALSNHLRRKYGFATIRGYTYSRAHFAVAPKMDNVKPPEPLYKPAPRRNKLIKCENTGQVFNTQNEACAAHGINAGQLSQHLKRHKGYKTIRGLVFSYCEADQPQVQPVQYPQP